MANFKQNLPTYLLVSLLGALIGCSETNTETFFTHVPSTANEDFAYSDIHQLSLTRSDVTKEIDETGFSPILKCKFHLENNQHGPWPKAWVAFNISVLALGSEVSSIKRAGILQGHAMDIEFQINLPKFGIKPDDIVINIQPIAWMPSFPLNIVDHEAVQ